MLKKITDIVKVKGFDEIRLEVGKENKIALYNENNGIKSLQKIISNKADSQGITRIVDVGTVTKEIGNAVITTKTTQISYKRRRVTDGQQ